jgi:hypothetical protein
MKGKAEIEIEKRGEQAVMGLVMALIIIRE